MAWRQIARAITPKEDSHWVTFSSVWRTVESSNDCLFANLFRMVLKRQHLAPTSLPRRAREQVFGRTYTTCEMLQYRVELANSVRCLASRPRLQNRRPTESS